MKKKLFSFVSVLACMLIFSSMTVMADGSAISTIDDDNNKSDITEVESVIEGYYSTAYDIWWNLEMEDMSVYLDMDSIQCLNMVTRLEENIQIWQYMIDMLYYKGKRERHDIYFDFSSVKIDGQEAKAVVNLSGETSGTPAYPGFVSMGKNVFDLRKVDGNWLIYNHDYDYYDECLYEGSKTEIVTNDFAEDKIRLDKQFSTTTTDTEEKKDNTIQPKDPSYTTYSYSIEIAVKYAKNLVYSLIQLFAMLLRSEELVLI